MAKKVFLVGAGPGDEGLITVKGLKCIQKADVIVYDNLVNSGLLSHSKKSAEMIYVGKKVNNHTLSQEEINLLLVEKANENKYVVRLKGGDPFIFGRGGEEALELIKNNIPFEVVPGVSSSYAALAYSGIPVTHRGVSSSFHVITGHEDPMKEKSDLDYKLLAGLSGTLVFLMGLNSLSKIVLALVKYGKPIDTAVAIVTKGTTPNQKVITGTLEDIEEKSKDADYPSIIVIGKVVELRDVLCWFEKKPLFGRKILVTRSRNQASVLSEKIEELGGVAVEFPTIEIVPNSDENQLKHMFTTLNNYNWLVFTSVNGVEIFFSKLREYNFDIRNLGQAKICAIGEATKQELEKYCLKVDFVPEEYVAEAVIEGLKSRLSAGDRILIPRAEVAREILPEKLKEFGVSVDVVGLYQTQIPYSSKEMLIDNILEADTITFTSSSTVSNFVEILGKGNLNLLKEKTIACIGPVTKQTAIDAGINVDKMAKKYTIEGLVEAIWEGKS